MGFLCFSKKLTKILFLFKKTKKTRFSQPWFEQSVVLFYKFMKIVLELYDLHFPEIMGICSDVCLN